VPLLIDTDIGTDPDDLQVLMIAGRTGLDVVGVTTVYGDTDLRARMAAVVAPLVGIDCPIVAGQTETLSGREVMWAGHEGDGVPGIDRAGYDRSRTAPDFISELAARHPGELDVLAIGPLTNVATALLADPDLSSRLRHLFVMGGLFTADADAPEHNVSADALATWIVLHSGVPTTMTGFEMTTRVVLTADELDLVTGVGEAGPILAANTAGFVAWLRQFGLPDIGRGSIPHDPIALLTRQRPELFRTEACRVDVVGWGPGAGQVTATADDAGPVHVVRDFDPGLVRREVLAALTAGA